MNRLPYLALVALALAGCARRADWSEEELAALADLRLGSEQPRPDPTNRHADDVAAAQLGQRLFFDRRLSANGAVACASCHDPAREFQDGLPLAKGLGTTARRTMPIAGTAASPWLFWDGRKDSLWSQALGPLESGVEHGSNRIRIARLAAQAYRGPYERVFGPLPDLDGLPADATPAGTGDLWEAWQRIPPGQQDAVNRVFANVGKAIEAYERRLRPGETRFDRYVDAVERGDADGAAGLLTRGEEAGLRLFVGKARCTRCHNGPELTNHDFANVGVPPAPGAAPDPGRHGGAGEVLQDEFNCLGRYSDAAPEACRELRSMHSGPQTRGQFKVPSLRGVAGRAPYMHAGQLRTLAEVIAHYDRAPAAATGESEIAQLGLDARERRELEEFLGALSAPLMTEEEWLKPPEEER
jgi:cytochrome c peroxidase